MNKTQLRTLVNQTIKEIGLHTPEAENLILGTIAQESAGAEYIKQVGGPALGICQMEAATHDDIWINYLCSSKRNGLVKALDKISATDEFTIHHVPDSFEMIWNLKYSIAMCRIHYLRVPEPIPFGLYGQAQYWKKYYNTKYGAGTVEQYMKSYQKWVNG